MVTIPEFERLCLLLNDPNGVHQAEAIFHHLAKDIHTIPSVLIVLTNANHASSLFFASKLLWECIVQNWGEVVWNDKLEILMRIRDLVCSRNFSRPTNSQLCLIISRTLKKIFLDTSVRLNFSCFIYGLLESLRHPFSVSMSLSPFSPLPPPSPHSPHSCLSPVSPPSSISFKHPSCERKSLGEEGRREIGEEREKRDAEGEFRKKLMHLEILCSILSEIDEYKDLRIFLMTFQDHLVIKNFFALHFTGEIWKILMDLLQETASWGGQLSPSVREFVEKSLEIFLILLSWEGGEGEIGEIGEIDGRHDKEGGEVGEIVMATTSDSYDNFIPSSPLHFSPPSHWIPILIGTPSEILRPRFLLLMTQCLTISDATIKNLCLQCIAKFANVRMRKAVSDEYGGMEGELILAATIVRTLVSVLLKGDGTTEMERDVLELCRAFYAVSETHVSIHSIQFLMLLGEEIFDEFLLVFEKLMQRAIRERSREHLCDHFNHSNLTPLHSLYWFLKTVTLLSDDLSPSQVTGEEGDTMIRRGEIGEIGEKERDQKIRREWSQFTQLVLIRLSTIPIKFSDIFFTMSPEFYSEIRSHFSRSLVSMSKKFLSDYLMPFSSLALRTPAETQGDASLLSSLLNTHSSPLNSSAPSHLNSLPFSNTLLHETSPYPSSPDVSPLAVSPSLPDANLLYYFHQILKYLSRMARPIATEILTSLHQNLSLPSLLPHFTETALLFSTYLTCETSEASLSSRSLYVPESLLTHPSLPHTLQAFFQHILSLLQLYCVTPGEERREGRESREQSLFVQRIGAMIVFVSSVTAAYIGETALPFLSPLHVSRQLVAAFLQILLNLMRKFLDNDNLLQKIFDAIFFLCHPHKASILHAIFCPNFDDFFKILRPELFDALSGKNLMRLYSSLLMVTCPSRPFPLVSSVSLDEFSGSHEFNLETARNSLVGDGADTDGEERRGGETREERETLNYYQEKGLWKCQRGFVQVSRRATAQRLREILAPVEFYFYDFWMEKFLTLSQMVATSRNSHQQMETAYMEKVMQEIIKNLHFLTGIFNGISVLIFDDYLEKKLMQVASCCERFMKLFFWHQKFVSSTFELLHKIIKFLNFSSAPKVAFNEGLIDLLLSISETVGGSVASPSYLPFSLSSLSSHNSSLPLPPYSAYPDGDYLAYNYLYSLCQPSPSGRRAGEERRGEERRDVLTTPESVKVELLFLMKSILDMEEFSCTERWSRDFDAKINLMHEKNFPVKSNSEHSLSQKIIMHMYIKNFNLFSSKNFYVNNFNNSILSSHQILIKLINNNNFDDYFLVNIFLMEFISLLSKARTLAKNVRTPSQFLYYFSPAFFQKLNTTLQSALSEHYSHIDNSALNSFLFLHNTPENVNAIDIAPLPQICEILQDEGASNENKFLLSCYLEVQGMVVSILTNLCIGPIIIDANESSSRGDAIPFAETVKFLLQILLSLGDGPIQNFAHLFVTHLAVVSQGKLEGSDEGGELQQILEQAVVNLIKKSDESLLTSLAASANNANNSIAIANNPNTSPLLNNSNQNLNSSGLSSERRVDNTKNYNNSVIINQSNTFARDSVRSVDVFANSKMESKKRNWALRLRFLWSQILFTEFANTVRAAIQ